MPAKPTPKPAGEQERAPSLRIILVRHGKAQRNSDSGRDEDRRLKPRGERQAKWLGKQLASLKITPDVLLHSPLHRAVQTASRLGDHLDCEITESDALAIGEPPRGVIDLIKKQRELTTVALVGHNPQFEELAKLLVPQFRKNGVDLRTGEALVIEIPKGADMTDAKLVSRLRFEEDDDE